MSERTKPTGFFEGIKNKLVAYFMRQESHLAMEGCMGTLYTSLAVEPEEPDTSCVPTCDELLTRTMDPSHPSQALFEQLKDGRMLDTCRFNGYSYAGYGPGRKRPRFSKLRAEAGMHDLASPRK